LSTKNRATHLSYQEVRSVEGNKIQNPHYIAVQRKFQEKTQWFQIKKRNPQSN
jgi:hypothetical protein